MVACSIDGHSDDIIAFASIYSNGGAGIILLNSSATDHIVEISLADFEAGDKFYFYEILQGNTGLWQEKIFVNGLSNTQYSKGGPAGDPGEIPARTADIGDGIKIRAKALSANYIMIEEK